MPKLITAKLVFYLFLCYLFDQCVMPLMSLGAAQPFVLYLMVVYSAFQWPWQRTLAIAFLVGLLRDVSGVHPLGVETSAAFMNAIGLIFLTQRMARHAMINRMLAAFFYLFASGLVVLVFSGLLQNPHWITWHAIGINFMIALISALAMPFVFFVSSKYFHDEPAIKEMGLFN